MGRNLLSVMFVGKLIEEGLECKDANQNMPGSCHQKNILVSIVVRSSRAEVFCRDTWLIFTVKRRLFFVMFVVKDLQDIQ